MDQEPEQPPLKVKEIYAAPLENEGSFDLPAGSHQWGGGWQLVAGFIIGLAVWIIKNYVTEIQLFFNE